MLETLEKCLLKCNIYEEDIKTIIHELKKDKKTHKCNINSRISINNRKKSAHRNLIDYAFNFKSVADDPIVKFWKDNTDALKVVIKVYQYNYCNDSFKNLNNHENVRKYVQLIGEKKIRDIEYGESNQDFKTEKIYNEICLRDINEIFKDTQHIISLNKKYKEEIQIILAIDSVLQLIRKEVFTNNINLNLKYDNNENTEKESDIIFPNLEISNSTVIKGVTGVKNNIDSNKPKNCKNSKSSSNTNSKLIYKVQGKYFYNKLFK